MTTPDGGYEKAGKPALATRRDDGGVTYEEWRCGDRVWSSLMYLDPERRARSYAAEMRVTYSRDFPVERRMIIESAWVEIANV